MSLLTLAGLAALGFTTPVPAQAASRLQSADTVHLVLAAEGNEARYRVREQLANVDFPSDAVGSTTKLEGAVVLVGAKFVSAKSKITIDLASLTTDSNMRDNYIRRRTLQTDSFPTATLVPTELRGVPAALPESGSLTFQLVGDLTVHGVTKQTTWEVTAKFEGGAVSGQAKTALKFADFAMPLPRVARVLSVDDDIRLEFDFRFVPAY